MAYQTITNLQATVLGVWSTAPEYEVTGAINGTNLFEPDLWGQADVDLLKAAGAIRVVAAIAPVNTVAPAITGTAQVGVALTLGNGTWDGEPAPSFTRKWQVSDTGTGGWTDIVGATNATYTPVTGNVGKYLRGVVTATNVAGTSSKESAATAAVIAA